MTEMPETHYVKSDDVHIAYQVSVRGRLIYWSFPASFQMLRQRGAHPTRVRSSGVSPPSAV